MTEKKTSTPITATLPLTGWDWSRFFRSLVVTSLIISLMIPPKLYAQSYAIGFSKYQKGDFKGAEGALIQTMKAQKPGKEAAKTLKLLGIIQYMQGNKGAASASFGRALAMDPSLRIGQGEVLDEGVIPFFEKERASRSIKGKNPSGLPQKSLARSNEPSKGSSSKRVPPPPPASKPRTPLAKDKAPAQTPKQTILKVASNAPAAQISIDGILAGKVGDLINTDPGTVQIEITAKGFISKKVNVTITKNRENSITVNLEKIPPPPPPKPKAPPVTVASKNPPTPLGKTPKQGADRAPSKPSSSRDGGSRARDPEGLFAPTPDEDSLFNDQPSGKGSSFASGGSGTDEFEEDLRAASAPPPMPVAQAPVVAQPAITPAPQVVQTPAYGGAVYVPPQPAYPYAPPQVYGGGYAAPVYAPPAYQSPPVYTPPPGAPEVVGEQPPQAVNPYDMPAPMPGDPAYVGAEDDPYTPASTRKTRKKFLYILPFGTGQFLQGRTSMGLLFLAGEAGLLGLAYQNYTAAEESSRNGTDELKNKGCSANYTDDCASTKSKFDAAVDSANQNMQYAFIGAGVLMAAGALEALIVGKNPSESSGSGKRKKKKSRQSNYKGFSALPPLYYANPYTLWSEDHNHEYQNSLVWDLRITPRSQRLRTASDTTSLETNKILLSRELIPYLALDLTWIF